jgi:glycosyltransferase involved in cell wall biosynthesis
MKTVTIILTNYNYGKYLSDCLDSVKDQSYPIHELIFIDDASTDDSIKVLSTWISINRPNFLVKLLFQSKNTGKNGVLNLAAREITGEYVSIVDTDDVLLPDFIEKHLSEIEIHNVDFSYSNNILIDETNLELSIGRSCSFDKELINTKSYIPDNALTKRAALNYSFPLDEKVKAGTKHHKWKKILSEGAIGIHIDEPLFKYRMHSKNLSGIGGRIVTDIGRNKNLEPMLSGYWPLESESA